MALVANVFNNFATVASRKLGLDAPREATDAPHPVPVNVAQVQVGVVPLVLTGIGSVEA